MGNITALNRYQAGTQIDQLAYTYTAGANKLQSVTDAISGTYGLVSGTTNYTWDGNGNMLSSTNTVNTQQNKSFTYNLLNLPIVATVPTGTATYTYDAAGNKLRKVSVINGITKYTDYISGIEYDGTTAADTLNFIQTEAGKAVHRGTKYEYEYYLGDNLGNTRVTFGTKTGTIVLYQQDDYYPFGLEINRSTISPKNEYLYNKKELQEELGVYDFGARGYDPMIGRWTTVDPMAEISRRWSTYNYVDDDPIRMIDPDGMKPMDQENREALDAAEALFSSYGAKTPNGGGENGKTEKGGDPPGTRPTAKADATKTVPKVPKVQPKKHTTPLTPTDQGTIKPYPDPHDVNNNDLGNPNTSLAAVGDVIPVVGAVMGGAELRAGLILKDAFTADELVNMAFHSGVGADDAAIAAGQTILRQTQIGAKLAELTQGMAMEPGTEAYKAWARLSEAWANSVPRGSTVNVYLNSPWARGIYLNYEKPILEARGVIINIIPVK